jgi:lambda repressor-like predicted transcriptional regulator
MTIEDYRIALGWSRSKLAREADIDQNTLKSAIDGNLIYRATAGKIANAISRELERQGKPPIKYTDLDGLTFAD